MKRIGRRGSSCWPLVLASSLLAAAADPDGTFRGVELIPVSAPQSWVVATDLNADGLGDVVLLLTSGAGLEVFLGRAGGGFDRQRVAAKFDNPLHASAGRLDGDSHQDLVVGFREGAKVFFGNGDGTFRDGPLLSSIFLGRAVQIAHLDADAHFDILLEDEQAGVIRTFLGDGAGNFTHTNDAPTINEPHDLDVVDLNADGLGACETPCDGGGARRIP